MIHGSYFLNKNNLDVIIFIESQNVNCLRQISDRACDHLLKSRALSASLENTKIKIPLWHRRCHVYRPETLKDVLLKVVSFAMEYGTHYAYCNSGKFQNLIFGISEPLAFRQGMLCFQARNMLVRVRINITGEAWDMGLPLRYLGDPSISSTDLGPHSA